jgi:hypothetical protein
MPKISINYTPELIDSAIKEHIEKYMNVVGEIEIEYMHRRKTKKVSAEITLSELKSLPPKETANTIVAAEEHYEIVFENLPVHEQEEAVDSHQAIQEGVIGEVDELAGIVEHMNPEELRKAAKENEAEIELSNEAEDLFA